MKTGRIAVHTDVFLEHLSGDCSPSALRLAMGRLFCYTTVFHAIQLFAMARTAGEKRAVKDAMAAMKVLGLNAKSARNHGELLSRRNTESFFNVLIAGLCIESRLPILADGGEDFKGIRGLHCVPTRIIRMVGTRGGGVADHLTNTNS